MKDDKEFWTTLHYKQDDWNEHTVEARLITGGALVRTYTTYKSTELESCSVSESLVFVPGIVSLTGLTEAT